MTSLWRHKRQNQTDCFEKDNSSSGAKWAIEFENRILFYD